MLVFLLLVGASACGGGGGSSGDDNTGGAGNGGGAQAAIDVPDVTGAPTSEVTATVQGTAEGTLFAAGLSVGTVTSQSSETVPAGYVISQSPVPCTACAASGDAVDLVVSSGPAAIDVPDVTGQAQSSAESTLLAAGLSVGTVTSQSSETAPAGNVISQSPVPCTACAASGDAVDLVVSSGPAAIDSDGDGDGHLDAADNCPLIANPSQVDVERDGIGDACDLNYDPVITPPLGTGFSTAETVYVGHFLSGDQTPPFPISDTERLFEGPSDRPGPRQRLLQFSYGATDSNYVYLDWIALPQDSAFYDASNLSRHEKVVDSMQAFLDLGYASANNKYVLVFDDTAAIPGETSECGGGTFFSDSWGDQDIGYVQLAGIGGKSCFTDYIAIHEMLHASGFSHASGVDCDGFVNGVPHNLMYPRSEELPCSTSQDRPRAIEYYLDDIMGTGRGHPSTPKKARAAWLYDSSIVRANNENTEVELDALEYATLGPKAVMIPLTTLPDIDQAAYWVEYRADGPRGPGVRVWFSGAEAMLTDTDWPYSIRDFTFASANYIRGIFLGEGQTFYDPYRGIEITRISSRVDELLPKTTVQVRRSSLLSGPRAIAVMRPDQQQVVTFENRGVSSVYIESVRLAGRDAGHFAIVSENCTAAILSNGIQCAVTVKSLDDNSLSDIRNATVEATTNDTLRTLAVHAIRTLPNSYPDR
jgi:hypothetical protein